MPSSANSIPPSHLGFRRVVLALAALLLLLAAAGIAYQSISIDRDRRAYPMPGQLVEVGGYNMHIDCAGREVRR